MDLSFDKLLEQFDLKKNEHQRNMHKINKRIDEIESHMDSMKKQLHSFDHQIESLEKDIKSTLSLINREDFSNSHQEHHKQNEEQNHIEKKNRHHKNEQHHEEQHKWAESILHNVEEYASNIFKNEKEDDHQNNQTNQNHQSRASKNAKKRKNDSELNPMPNIIPEQYSASISNHQTNTANIDNQIGTNSYDESFLAQSYIQESFEQINQEHTLNQSTFNANNNDQTIQKDINQLEQNYEDLSIDDWEDKTTNLSMSEWFEVDPRTER